MSAVAGRWALVAPGGNSNAEVPLVKYAMLAARRRGAQVRSITWRLSGDRGGFAAERERVTSQVAAVADEILGTGAAPIVIGKSLGSLAAPVVADRGLAAVWFTPLLTDEPTVAALRRAAGHCLLIGGTADPFWDGPTARLVTAHVVEVEGADHGMFVPGRLASSAAVLGQVATAVEDFLDSVVWPVT
jgi:hypothetical protein